MEGVQSTDPDRMEAQDHDGDAQASRGDGPMALPVAEAIVWAILDAHGLAAAKRIYTCVSCVYFRVFS